jgi:transposase
MDVATLGIDLGKTWCSLVGLNPEGAVVLRRKVRQERLVEITAKLPPRRIGMEASRGAHYLTRLLLAQGHDARLMPPTYVKPYVKSQKNDDRDAEAIAEAVTRPTMRFVPVKSVEQLDMQALHRIRERLMGRRIQLTNQLRAILYERGISCRRDARSSGQLSLSSSTLLTGRSRRGYDARSRRCSASGKRPRAGSRTWMTSSPRRRVRMTPSAASPRSPASDR